MDQNIFRKASMEKISSPEQLNDYIRISRPGIWIALAAAFVLLSLGTAKQCAEMLKQKEEPVWSLG